ncbi:MAG: sodium/proline symporter PutP [Planctomycetes bacterium]|nr:sodium/proline symporter PutP [Planctomycetota bacterium]
METPTLITFVAYFIGLTGIGLYFWRKNQSVEDYLLGGRGMGAWVTALSAQASDMSGWLLMGLPGAIYVSGLSGSWIAFGLFIGTVLNWCLVSGRLRVYTQATDAITLPCFFEERFSDPTGMLRILSAIIILVFFTIYASSGLVATGRLFESTFNISYQTAVLSGCAIIVLYTFLGGFMAVCWTDLFQGLLMLIALVVVPVMAYRQIGGHSAFGMAMQAKGISQSLVPQGKMPILSIISAMAWGLGYFGQPHILTRFMSVKSLHKLNESKIIAIVWVAISLCAAVMIGLVGIGMFESLDVTQKDHEKVFILMIGQVMGPWFGGIMLAAILSAIMSTIDSQLLVSSSALTEDFYQKVLKRDAGEKEVVLIGRVCVVLISVVALVLALNPKESILGIVAYAWGGLGAAFGPLVLCALFCRRTTWQAALAGMVCGTAVVVVWKQVGWSSTLYELVPGFLANGLMILIVSTVFPQSNTQVLTQYDAVVQTLETDSN